MPTIDQLKIQLSVVGVAQATANINRLNSGLKGLSAQQKQLNAQAALLQQQIRLQQAQQGAGQGSFGQRLQNAFNSSRFGVTAGGGLQLFPLISSVARLIGPAGVAFVAAVTAGAGALKAMTDAAVESAETLRNLAFATGSQGGNLGSLRGLNNALGGNAGSLSSSLQHRITSDPMAMSVAASMGIFNLQRPFGQVDEGENLLKAIQKLREIPDFKARLRTARILGLEDTGGALSMSEGQFQKSKQRGQLNEQLFGDPQTQQNVADFTSALSDLGDAFKNVLGALGKQMLPWLTKFVNGFADALNGLADWIDGHPNFIGALASVANGFLDTLRAVGEFLDNNRWIMKLLAETAGGGVFGTMGSIGNVTDPGNPHTEALDANMRATVENTQQLEQLNQLLPGVFGRSERAGRALPGALAPGRQGPYLNQNDLRNFRLNPI